MCLQISAIQDVTGDSELMMMENFLKELVYTAGMGGIIEAEALLEGLGIKLGQ